MKASILDIIGMSETEGKHLSDAQNEYLLKTYKKQFCFTYAKAHLAYIFSMSEVEYAAMEYYFEWEYERENRELLLNYEGQVIVSYHLCERVMNIMDKLAEVENENRTKE